MKNPFNTRSVTPALLFFQSAFMLVFGIFCVANSGGVFAVLQWVAGLSLFTVGISRGWSMLAEKKTMQGILIFVVLTLAAVALIVYPMILSVSAGGLFGIWFLINGTAHATICIQCVVQGLHGRVRYAVTALASLIFGAVLLMHPQMEQLFPVAGIYLILFAVTLFIDAFSEILLFGKGGTSLKRHVHISLPLFITALLPGKLLDDFNVYFKTNPEEAVKALRTSSRSAETPLEVFIHLSDKGAQRTGHVDIRFMDTVLSYGCYDHHSHRFGGMVADGTMVVCDSKKYIDYCTRREGKILVGFGIVLNTCRKKSTEKIIKNLTDVLVPWQSDYEKGQMSGETPDAASGLIMETGARIFKVSKGTFRRYYALNTNCVKLADQILGASGLGLVSTNGIAVPGAYYTMLNGLYERKDTIVTTRNIYKEKG